jgi:hypothetical protein
MGGGIAGLQGGAGQFGLGGGNFQGLGQVDKGVLTTNFRSHDGFVTRHQEGSLVITITGTVTSGKVKVSQVKIQDGGQTDKYDGLDNVPEQYQDKVKNLVEINEKSNISIEIKKSPTAKPAPEKKKD